MGSTTWRHILFIDLLDDLNWRLLNQATNEVFVYKSFNECVETAEDIARKEKSIISISCMTGVWDYDIFKKTIKRRKDG